MMYNNVHDNIIYAVVVQEGQQATIVINNAQWDKGKLVMVQSRFLQDKSLTLEFSNALDLKRKCGSLSEWTKTCGNRSQLASQASI